MRFIIKNNKKNTKVLIIEFKRCDNDLYKKGVFILLLLLSVFILMNPPNFINLEINPSFFRLRQLFEMFAYSFGKENQQQIHYNLLDYSTIDYWERIKNNNANLGASLMIKPIPQRIEYSSIRNFIPKEAEKEKRKEDKNRIEERIFHQKRKRDEEDCNKKQLARGRQKAGNLLKIRQNPKKRHKHKSDALDNMKNKIIPLYINFAVKLINNLMKLKEIKGTVYPISFDKSKMMKNKNIFDLFENKTLYDLLSQEISSKYKKIKPSNNKEVLEPLLNQIEILNYKNKEIYKYFIAEPSEVRKQYNLNEANETNNNKGMFFKEYIERHKEEDLLLTKLIHLVKPEHIELLYKEGFKSFYFAISELLSDKTINKRFFEPLLKKVAKRINNNRETEKGKTMNSEEICNIIQKEAKVEEKQKTITREKYEYLGNEFMNIIYKKNIIKEFKNNKL